MTWSRGRSASCAAAAPARSSHRRRGRASPRRHRLTTLPSAHGSRRQSGLRLFRRPTGAIARMAGGRAMPRLEDMYSECEVTDMFTTIVAGVDGLPGGRDALALAQRLADLAGGAVVAVHVHPYEPLPFRGLRPRRRGTGARRGPGAARGAARRGRRRGPGDRDRRDIAGARVTRIADALEADLVVIGSPHRGSLGRVVAGDTARAVIQGAARPVLVARHSATMPFAGQVIGVGYDGSPESRATLAWAGRFALSVGATVRVLCAAEPPQGFSPSISYGINWVALVPERLEYAETLVADAVAELGNGATGEAVAGIARDELVGLSEHVDLLVLGSRGYGPVRRALLGGSADRIVHAAACPVLVVPRGAHEDHATERAAAAEVIAGLTGDLTLRQRAPRARAGGRARTGPAPRPHRTASSGSGPAAGRSRPVCGARGRRRARSAAG